MVFTLTLDYTTDLVRFKTCETEFTWARDIITLFKLYQLHCQFEIDVSRSIRIEFEQAWSRNLRVFSTEIERKFDN